MRTPFSGRATTRSKARWWLLLLLLAGLGVRAEEWSTAAPRPPARGALAENDAAQAGKACREIGDLVALPPAGPTHRPPGNPDSGAAPQPAPPAPRPGGVGGANVRDPRRLPFVIAILCQDRPANDAAIVSLYATLTGRPGAAPPVASGRPAPSAADAATARARLFAASERFIALRVDNEIESNLGEKIWATGNSAQLQTNAFIALLAQIDRGVAPPAGSDEAAANRQLQSVYRALEKRVAGLGVPQASADLRETEEAWLAYRAAWRSYLMAAHPALARGGVIAYLTLERVSQLQAFAASAD